MVPGPAVGDHRFARLAVTLALLTPILPSRAEATVVKALSLREKAEIAPVVIHGEVKRVDVSWRTPGAFIQTIVTVRVIESLKGGFEPGDSVRVYRGGGRMGDIHQTAPGLSSYEAGEEVVLFLEPLGAEYVGIGIGIAKYAVRHSDGEKMVTHTPNVSGVTFREGARPIIEPILPMSPTPLTSFLKRVRSFAREHGAKRAVAPTSGAPALPARAPVPSIDTAKRGQ